MSSVEERPGPEVRVRLLAAARRTPASRPGAWRRRVLGAVGFAVVWILAMAVVVRARSDWGELPSGPLVATFAVLLAVACAAAGVGLTRGRAMAGPPTERLIPTVALGLGVLLGLVLFIDAGGPATRVFTGAALWLRSVPCALMVVAVGLPLVGAALVPFAGLTLGRPGLTGACVGLAAATLAHALVRFHCAVGGAGHALLGHLLAGIPLMLLGAWFSRARVVERLLARFGAVSEEKT